jgi:hypothetical protein
MCASRSTEAHLTALLLTYINICLLSELRSIAKENPMRRLGIKLAGTSYCLLLLGCNIPTALPTLEQRWILPLEQIKIGVVQLLPAGIQLGDGTLEVNVDTFSTSASLNTLCSNCAALNGSTATVPGFTSFFSGSVNLPDNISSVEISSGSLEVAVTNGFSFDPLAGGGVITATISDGQGGSQLAEVVFEDSLDPASTVTQSLSIGSARVGTTIFASIEITSPGGQIAPIDTNEQLSVDIMGTALILSAGTVSIERHSVEIDTIILDLEHIGSELTEKIVNGSVIFDVVNPFGASASGNINIGSTSKSFTINESGTSRTEISYTGNELRSFLGKKGVTLSLSATVSGSSITVKPGQELTISSQIDCIIRIG